MSSKRWKITYYSHFGTQVEADTEREAGAKALAWLQEEYGYDLANSTQFEVELDED